MYLLSGWHLPPVSRYPGIRYCGQRYCGKGIVDNRTNKGIVGNCRNKDICGKNYSEVNRFEIMAHE